MGFDFEVATDQEMEDRFGDARFGLDGRWSDQTFLLKQWAKVEKLDLTPLWALTPKDWSCPGCRRHKKDIAFVSKGVLCAKLVGHHDHAADFAKNWHNHSNRGSWLVGEWDLERFCEVHLAPFLRRFDNAVICNRCNEVDQEVKNQLGGLADYFSFSVEEIAKIVTSDTKAGFVIDFGKAEQLYSELKPMHAHRMKIAARLVELAAKGQTWVPLEREDNYRFREETVERYASGTISRAVGQVESDSLLMDFLDRSVALDGFGVNGPGHPRTTGKIPTPEDYLNFKRTDVVREAAWKAVGDDWECPGCGRTKFQSMRWSRQERWVAGLYRNWEVPRGEPGLHYLCEDCTFLPSKFDNWLKIMRLRHPWEGTGFSAGFATTRLLREVVKRRNHELHLIDYNRILELLKAALRGEMEPGALFVQRVEYRPPPDERQPGLFDDLD